MQRESIYDLMTNAEKEVANLLKEFGIQMSFKQQGLSNSNVVSIGWTLKFLNWYQMGL